MTVHPNSVIDTTIQNYDSDFYDSLTNKENYCYESGTNGSESDYKPFFQDLSDAITGTYFGGSFDKDALIDLIQSAYSFLQLNKMYGFRDDLLDEANAHPKFNIADLIPDTLSRSEDYYDDGFTETDPETGETTFRAPNLEDDIDLVNNSAVSTSNSRITSSTDTLRNAVQTKVHELLFTTPDSQGSFSKDEMYDQIFSESGYGYGFYADFHNIPDVDPFN